MARREQYAAARMTDYWAVLTIWLDLGGWQRATCLLRSKVFFKFSSSTRIDQVVTDRLAPPPDNFFFRTVFNRKKVSRVGWLVRHRLIFSSGTTF